MSIGWLLCQDRDRGKGTDTDDGGRRHCVCFVIYWAAAGFFTVNFCLVCKNLVHPALDEGVYDPQRSCEFGGDGLGGGLGWVGWVVVSGRQRGCN